nr:hypothetical protein BaRGS_018059 [Batillaria attramentaria]
MGEEFRLHSPRSYYSNQSLSTFRSPGAGRTDRTLPGNPTTSSNGETTTTTSTSTSSSPASGLNSTLTAASPRSYLQAQATHHVYGNIGSGYNRNISFSDDSVTANTTVDHVSPLEHRPGDDSYGVRGKVVSFSVADSYQTTPRRTNSTSRLAGAGYPPHLNQSSVAAGDMTYPGPYSASRAGQQSSVGQPYSMTDMRDALGDTTLGTMVDDEDRTTTTSGSYTINADDLCNEIDNLFFNDVVV